MLLSKKREGNNRGQVEAGFLIDKTIYSIISAFYSTIFYEEKKKSNQFSIYLGHTKSSGNDTFLPYIRLKEIFFLYRLIEKKKLYLSMLFDHTSTSIITLNYL